MIVKSSIEFMTFPVTVPPDPIFLRTVRVFQKHEREVSSTRGNISHTSNQLLAVLASDLKKIGWEVESGRKKDQKILRPVLFGENGMPDRTYEIDAYHSKTKCGLEVEAGRAFLGNAVYRDIVRAMVMVDVERFVIAVAKEYTHKCGTSKDYDSAKDVGRLLYSQTRVKIPYQLAIIGY